MTDFRSCSCEKINSAMKTERERLQNRFTAKDRSKTQSNVANCGIQILPEIIVMSKLHSMAVDSKKSLPLHTSR